LSDKVGEGEPVGGMTGLEGSAGAGELEPGVTTTQSEFTWSEINTVQMPDASVKVPSSMAMSTLLIKPSTVDCASPPCLSS